MVQNYPPTIQGTDYSLKQPILTFSDQNIHFKIEIKCNYFVRDSSGQRKDNNVMPDHQGILGELGKF